MLSIFQTRTGEFDDDNGDKVTENAELDYTKEVEVIRLSKNGGRTDDGVVVIDFKRVSGSFFLVWYM